MKRILQVSSYAPPHGGGAQVAADQARALREVCGDQVSVITFESGFSYLQEEGVDVHLLKGMAVGQDWLPTLTDIIRVWKEVGRADVLVLHSQFYALSNLAAIVGRLRGRRVLCIHHGRLLAKWRNHWQTRVMNKLAQQWLVFDPDHPAYLRQFVGRLKPVHQIQNGVWSEELARLKTSSPATLQHFVYSGRVVKDKGMAELLEAVKHFPELHFDIVGDGAEATHFKKFPNTTVHGFLSHDQAVEVVAKADCLILPSHHETLPLVIIEALVLDKPVIATDLNASIRQLVKGNGILIPARDSTALMEAIIKATRDGLRVTNPTVVAEMDWKTVILPIRKLL